MYVKTYAAAIEGVNAFVVTTEVNAGGTPVISKKWFFLVGLPDNAIREGVPRMESAIKNSGYNFPRVKMVINLAPADVPKEGSSYDLPIAIGILGGTGQIRTDKFDSYMMMGELSLDGALRPVRGVLPMAMLARSKKFRGLFVPKQNAKEASIVNDLDVYGISNLREIVEFLNGDRELQPIAQDTRDEFFFQQQKNPVDFSDVKGQENIKRALEIAASGGHNAILIGPPGSGKTMLARRMSSILPPLTLQEALETTKIHSVAGVLPADSSLIAQRPFRAPHHTISDVALVGGGSNPLPGEISLAHNGVLFLDELPEFKRSVLEVLRQPMEDQKVTISRAKTSVDYPASFILIASMNPCPCGYYNHPDKDCVCAPGVVKRYLNKISGPLLDRIDLHVEVTPVSLDQLSGDGQQSEESNVIRERVMQARNVQSQRFDAVQGIYCNAQMASRNVRDICKLNPAGQTLLKAAMEKLQLSARAYDKILKVSRTIADLEGSEEIKIENLAEAIQFRSLDRENWVI